MLCWLDSWIRIGVRHGFVSTLTFIIGVHVDGVLGQLVSGKIFGDAVARPRRADNAKRGVHGRNRGRARTGTWRFFLWG